VQLLGYREKVQWKQDNKGLKIKIPPAHMNEMAITFKVTLA
jgi:hypothetical protein